MKSVSDKEFASYGRVHAGYDVKGLKAAMAAIPLPEAGLSYVPSIPELEKAECFPQLTDEAFGGLPIQVGMCWGHNTRLNCLEYHRCSGSNLGTHPFVLLLAHQWDVEKGTLDTGRVEAFYVPAGVLVEVYATTLHHAPCHVEEADGFRVAVVLPKGTNTALPERGEAPGEARLLAARNKWLLAHPDSPEAARGAWVGLTGEDLDIKELKGRNEI